MNDTPSCPVCASPLPADAPAGTCPKCLLAAGFESAGGDAPADDARDAPEVAEIARLFPELDIEGVIGRGGMGVVLRARQRQLDRVVALKVLPRDIAAQAGAAARFEERFTREARALARLSHPHIVALHEFGEREGLYYFLMEYVDGANLRESMCAGRLAPREALAIVPQICDALQYAHEQGVVHRDIKPENVLLDRAGHVKIADFGLAKLVKRGAGDRTLTRHDLVMGTPQYMAPEQIETPADVDHRADIYSLGVVLYEMLTGELPLGRFAPPSAKVQVDVRLDDVVLRTLEKERERRYQSAGELKTGIGVASEPAAIAAASTDVPRPRRHGRHEDAPWSTMALVGMLLTPAAAVLAILATSVLAPGPGGALQRVALTLVAGLGVGGICVSVVAAVRIARSKGRLHGMWMALVGIALPLMCCLPAAGFMTLRAQPPAPPIPAALPARAAPASPDDVPPPPEPVPPADGDVVAPEDDGG